MLKNEMRVYTQERVDQMSDEEKLHLQDVVRVSGLTPEEKEANLKMLEVRDRAHIVALKEQECQADYSDMGGE